MANNRLFVLAGVLSILVLSWYGWGWISSSSKPSPQQLADTALKSPNPQEKERAAVRLAQMEYTAVPEMCRVLQESDVPAVKAAMIQGLAVDRDFNSMDTLLNAMNDPILLVRVRAAGAVQRMLQIEVPGYRPEAPPEERLKAIKIYRAEWEKMRVSPALKNFREKLNQSRQGL